MGFIMDDVGNANIEARRESFILNVNGARGHSDERLDVGYFEALYADIPDIYWALEALARREKLPWPPERPGPTREQYLEGLSVDQGASSR